MNILLTGAAGYIGSALLQQLQGGTHHVLATSRTGLTQTGAGISSSSGDLLNAAYCRELCTGIDTIVHLAGPAHTQGSLTEMHRGIVELSGTLADAAAARGVRRFIYISSTRANYPFHSAYARQKRDTEELLLAMHESGQLKVCCLRPALVYGAGMRGNLATLLRLLQRRLLPVFPAGTQPLGMISLQDCCQAIVASLETVSLDGRSWELNDGQTHTLDQLVQQVRQHLGYSLPWLKLPASSVKLAALLAQLSAPITGTSLGLGTWHALYREPYRKDDGFVQATAFRPQQTFTGLLPQLLEQTA